MKTGIFTDVHANLEGLEEALSVMAMSGVERYWCLGDVVGYGASPNECVARVREVSDVIILGNHDAACAGIEDISTFNKFARDAVTWTANQLTQENLDWLKNLPLTSIQDDFLLVHGSPYEPRDWHYVTSVGEVVKAFNATPARFVCVGHSHQPAILLNRNQEYVMYSGAHLNIEEPCRYLINAGSTGQPRDGDPRASYVIHDDTAGTLSLGRVAYDIGVAQRKIRAAGLPEVLATRLGVGT